MAFGGLCYRRSCLVPTLRGWLVLLALLLTLGLTAALGLYPFLAQTHPCDTGPVVVEGWASLDTMQTALAEHRRHHSPLLYVTGEVLGNDLVSVTGLHSYAELGAVRLVALGLEKNQVQGVPALVVKRDRTFASAVALKQWFAAHGGVPSQLTVVSEGPHARRSHMLFQQAFGKATEVGIVAAMDTDRSDQRWWTNSEGFRFVTAELIAYVYATLFFWRTGA